MSTTLESGPGSAPGSEDAERPRTRVAKRIWLSVLIVAIVGGVIGALVVLSWMVNEIHFDRPSPQFDELETQLESLPGVESVDKERWVEAPIFANPTSWVSVAVDEAGLPGLLDVACATDYPDPVTWSIRVRTPEATEVSLHSTPTAPTAEAADARCPDFGFDAARMVDELGRVAPGLAIQPAIWENGRLALVSVDEHVSSGFTDLLPLVEHSRDLVVAAGLDASSVVEINAANLGLVLAPGESDRYLALLTELAGTHGVSSYWGDTGATSGDETVKVQIVAPDEQHAAIEQAMRSSGLPGADVPVRFIEQ